MSHFRINSFFLHFGVSIFLVVFIKEMVPSEAVRCYYCTDFPNTPLYTKGCGDSIPPDRLLEECRQINSAFSDNFQLLSSSSSMSSGGSNESISSSVDWLCAKVVAGIQTSNGTNNYVLRGCVKTVVEIITNRCEDIDNDYMFYNFTVSAGKACFCDTDGCNSGKSLAFTDVLLFIPFLIKLYSFKENVA